MESPIVLPVFFLPPWTPSPQTRGEAWDASESPAVVSCRGLFITLGLVGVRRRSGGSFPSMLTILGVWNKFRGK